MKLLLFVLGLSLVAAAIFIFSAIAKNLHEIGVLYEVIGLFALSLLSGGIKMIFASFFVP